MNDDADNSDFDINPDDFESQDGLMNMGRMGLTVFRSIIRDGGSWNEAFSVTAAFFAGMAKGMATDD